jgi:Protein of unknown function (DUF3485)
MTRMKRIVICIAIITIGLTTQVALDGACRIERPPLRRPLASLPTELGDWIGAERPVKEDIVRQSQSSEYLSREYESVKHPGLKLAVWVNYSIRGANLRHTPKICLPSGGWTEVESLTRTLEVPTAHGPPIAISRLGYSQGELVLHVGFWYYIFGEGKLENYIRSLPITSQSSHGRATRGSSMTIEIFYPGDRDPDGEALREFAEELVRHLDPILPEPRAAYYQP